MAGSGSGNRSSKARRAPVGRKRPGGRLMPLPEEAAAAESKARERNGHGVKIGLSGRGTRGPRTAPVEPLEADAVAWRNLHSPEPPVLGNRHPLVRQHVETNARRFQSQQDRIVPDSFKI